MALVQALRNGPIPSRPKAFTVICFVVVAVFLCAEKAKSAAAAEYQVKAAFLFNFAKFVEWPPNSFPDANTPFVIGVLGQDPFGSYLDETVRGEHVNGRQLTVHRYRSLTDIKNCQVLFISRSESQRLVQIVANLKYRKILIVTDADGGADGVMIRFINEGNKIRFKIDVQAAKAANLTISSKLLRLG